MANNHGTYTRTIGGETVTVIAYAPEDAVRMQFDGWTKVDPPPQATEKPAEPEPPAPAEDPAAETPAPTKPEQATTPAGKTTTK